MSLEEDIKKIFNTMYKSEVKWLRLSTIRQIAEDMKDANEDTAMDKEFRETCNRVIDKLRRKEYEIKCRSYPFS